MAAKEQEKSEAAVALEERAFSIFRDLASSNRRNTRKHDALATEAFQLAAAFNAIAAGVIDGSVSTEAPKPLKKVMVKVPRMIVKPDFAGFENVIDPLTKKPVIDEVPADHFAFAPNAPLEHPANARFVPVEGPDLKERVNRTRAELLLAN